MVVTNALGASGSRTLTYLELPQAGIATPIERVSVDSAGVQATTTSRFGVGSAPFGATGDGQSIFFSSDVTDFGLPVPFGVINMYVKDRATGMLSVAAPCGDCPFPSVSLDGARVAYRDEVARGIAVREVFSASPAGWVDVAPDGGPPNAGPGTARVALSGNGRFVAFTHPATNLDTAAGDTPGTADLFVRDLDTAFTTRLTIARSITALGISGDGRYVVFTTTAQLVPEDTNTFSDVYLIDRERFVDVGLPDGLTKIASGNAASLSPLISTDGSTVAFSSASSDLVPEGGNGFSQVFVVELSSGAISRVSVAADGTPADAFSNSSGLSANGKRVLFSSAATNLSANDIPTTGNLFVHDRLASQTWLVDAAADGTLPDNFTTASLITADGRAAAFGSRAANLVPDDTNALVDAFVKTLPPDTPAGVNVTADPVDPATGQSPVLMTFGSILAEGQTSLAISDAGQPLPSGFSLGDPARYYDVFTTASFAGQITLCIDYTGTNFEAGHVPRLLHFESGQWNDITSSHDVETRVICGQTGSLSPFVVAGQPAAQYSALARFDQARIYNAGSTIPIRVQILDGAESNVSAADLPLVATGVRLVFAETDWGTPQDAGRSNPALSFAFTMVQGEPGYRFNLKTEGFVAGSYELRFRVGTGGPELTVAFQVR